MRRLFLPVALLGVALAPMSAADLRMKATTTWAENISRSSSPLDWRDSLIGEVSVTASLGQHPLLPPWVRHPQSDRPASV
jgi:hypothetical protein